MPAALPQSVMQWGLKAEYLPFVNEFIKTSCVCSRARVAASRSLHTAAALARLEGHLQAISKVPDTCILHIVHMYAQQHRIDPAYCLHICGMFVAYFLHIFCLLLAYFCKSGLYNLYLLHISYVFLTYF